jgi:hypothetical protein
MSTNCIHCLTQKRTGPDLLCDMCRESTKALLAGPATALDLLLALAPKLEEDILLAFRFLYYVKAKPVIPDNRYDEAEKEFIDRPDTTDTPLMNPGSDKAADYPDHVKALAFYLATLGWQAGQSKKPEAQESLF